MHNILSIDFDWIMAPSIEAYNSLDGSGVRDWATYKLAAPAAILPADLEKYHQLYQLVKSMRNQFERGKVAAAKDHMHIAERAKLWIENADEEVAIYNIDHHHDLGYGADRIPDYGLVDDSNWATYLAQQYPNKLKHYYWLGNPNSLVPASWVLNIYPDFRKLESIDELNDVHFDEIFVCLSPPYVPSEYHNLFYVLEDALDLTIKK